EKSDDEAKQDRKQEREEKRPRGFLDMPPERRRGHELRQIAERRERRGHRLGAGEFEQQLPNGKQHSDQDHPVHGAAPGFRGHPRLRRCIRICSQWDSAALTAIETTRINRISGYMILLSKLL